MVNNRKFMEKLNYVKVYFGISFTLICFLSIVIYIFAKGFSHLNLEFIFSFSKPEGESLMPMIITTLLVIFLTILIAVPVGIGSAIYLNEYAKKGSKIVNIIRLATETLSGIPSIIYGLFGFLFFLLTLRWSWSVLAGVCTLSIMILPTIIRSCEEALKTVPDSFREGSYALGAGKLRTILKIVLPSSLTGILASIIISIGRIVGETAAVVLTAGTVAKIPKSLFDSASTLSVFMYTLTSEGSDFNKAYATAIVLMIIVLSLNLLANYLTKLFRRD